MKLTKREEKIIDLELSKLKKRIVEFYKDQKRDREFNTFEFNDGEGGFLFFKKEKGDKYVRSDLKFPLYRQ